MNKTIDADSTIDPKSYQITGILLLILGIIGIVFPYFASTMIVWIIAFLLLFGGIVFFIIGLKGGKGSWAGILLGVIVLAIGIIIFAYPQHTLSVITVIMGIFFIIDGIALLLLAYAVRPRDGWWAPAISGFISLILGLLIFVEWPSNSEWIIGMFVGINLLLEGISLMLVGYVE